jgi:hypothetical protein
LGKNVASILRVEKHADQETRMKQVASRALLHFGFLLGLFSEPEDGADMFLQNVGQI